MVSRVRSALFFGVRSPLFFGLPFLLTHQYSRCYVSRDGNLNPVEDNFLSPVEEILREAFVFDLFVHALSPSFGAAEGPVTIGCLIRQRPTDISALTTFPPRRNEEIEDASAVRGFQDTAINPKSRPPTGTFEIDEGPWAA
jgi:hypothetical protein